MTVKEKQKLESLKTALRAFRAARKKAGIWPELQEVANELGLSVQRTEVLLKGLVEKGELVKVGRYRGYRLITRTAKPMVRRAS